jgi:S1-C subfamily serine protease
MSPQKATDENLSIASDEQARVGNQSTTIDTDTNNYISPQPIADKKRTAIGVIALIVVGALIATSGALNPGISTAGISQFLQNITHPGTVINSDQKIVKEESLVIDVVNQTSSSVVSIGAKRQSSSILEPNSNDAQGIGTGFIISANGLILTNKHVVSEDNVEYSVITNDDKEYKVEKVYRDPSNDLAIIKINANGLKPLELGDSSTLQVGQFVIAIGNALGEFSNTVTTGVVSGLGRGIVAGDALGGSVEQLDNVIQTDAAINQGNSGGPLLNSAGQVVGINTAVSQNAQNIGFAIPVNVAKPIIDEFNRTGRIIGPPDLGVAYQPISRQTAILNDVPQGMYLSQVATDSPASQAGLASQDIITKVDDTQMSTDKDLAEYIRSKKIGDTIRIEYWRDGETKTTSAKLIEAPAQ